MYWTRAILHVDMDAFYVNVHLLDHAEDAGLPLVVGGKPDERGVVSSASYEARQFGVRSAMPTAQAVRLIPRLKIVSPDWPRIRECSRGVMDVLEQYGPLEQISVDEAYIDLSATADPAALAAEIRERLPAETRLPASVGLAGSKLVAKVASDHQKPRGLTIVPPGEEAAFLAPLPVRVIWGIGPRPPERRAALGLPARGPVAAPATARPDHRAVGRGIRLSGPALRPGHLGHRPAHGRAAGSAGPHDLRPVGRRRPRPAAGRLRP